MTKELHVAIMKRSTLKNKFLRQKIQANRDNYKIRRNLCKKLLRKTKNSYFSNRDTKKPRIIELFGKQLFFSLQTNCQKVKILLIRMIKAFLMEKNLKYLTRIFLMLCPT